MNGIQSTGNMPSISAMFNKGGPCQGSMPPGACGKGPPSHITSAIKNDEGQSILDIQDQLHDAVTTALESADGTEDKAKLVQDAINQTLEDNGFDLEEVNQAMEMQGMGGPKFGGMASGIGAGASRPDLNSMLQNDEEDQNKDLVLSFLENFKSGSNLDLML